MTIQRGKRRVLVHVEELGGKRGVSGLWGCKGREKRGTSCQKMLRSLRYPAC